MGVVGLGDMDKPLPCGSPLPGMLRLQDAPRVALMELAEAHESSRGVDVASGAGDAASVASDVASGTGDLASGAGDAASVASDVAPSPGDVASGAVDVASAAVDVASAAVDAASVWVYDAFSVVDVSGRGISRTGIGVRGSLISTEGALEVAIEAFSLLERDGLEAEGDGPLSGEASAIWTVGV